MAFAAGRQCSGVEQQTRRSKSFAFVVSVLGLVLAAAFFSAAPDHGFAVAGAASSHVQRQFAVRGGGRTSMKASGLKLPLRESELIQPDEEPQRPAYWFGFVSFAEKFNGKAAMIGFVLLLLIEAISGQGFLDLVGFGTAVSK
mmetsp:Transcript_89353/g.251605  ORF Transcript_89353/g.251605 Transcript_89353/m.251605 type:complete len:143 (-) Transcript_89353:122-550(-)